MTCSASTLSNRQTAIKGHVNVVVTGRDRAVKGTGRDRDAQDCIPQQISVLLEVKARNKGKRNNFDAAYIHMICSVKKINKISY